MYKYLLFLFLFVSCSSKSEYQVGEKLEITMGKYAGCVGYFKKFNSMDMIVMTTDEECNGEQLKYLLAFPRMVRKVN